MNRQTVQLGKPFGFLVAFTIQPVPTGFCFRKLSECRKFCRAIGGGWEPLAIHARSWTPARRAGESWRGAPLFDYLEEISVHRVTMYVDTAAEALARLRVSE